LVRGKDTGPEKMVRSLVHRLGYRFRLHAANLPGKPDLVFPSRQRVIFVHGCFWHRHDCSAGRIPRTRVRFWTGKLEANRLRDGRCVGCLRRMGWGVMVIWECQLAQPERIAKRVIRFLER